MKTEIKNVPEMHCWIGVVSSQELIDFTHGLVARAREAGFLWNRRH